MFKIIKELFGLSRRIDQIEQNCIQALYVDQEEIKQLQDKINKIGLVNNELIKDLKKDVGILKSSHTKMKDKMEILICKIDTLKNLLNEEMEKSLKSADYLNLSLERFKRIFDHQLGKIDVQFLKNYINDEMNGIKTKIKKIDKLNEGEEKLDLRLNNVDKLCKELSARFNKVDDINEQFKNAMAIQCQKNVKEMQHIVEQNKKVMESIREMAEIKGLL